MSIKCELEINNKKEIYTINHVAKQSNGSVMLQMGKCVLLATVVTEYDNPVEEDFTPLTVQYIEKTYAYAKLPGGFIKREGKPNDFETLTSRVIDRSLRPLFPKGYVYPTTITVMVLSADKEVDLQVAALNAASAALYLSDLPINKLVCGVRLAKIDGEIIINPTSSELKNSILDLYIAGSENELLMIEMKSISSLENNLHSANEVSEYELVELIGKAQEAIKNATITYKNNFTQYKKEDKDIELKPFLVSDEIVSYVKERYSQDIREALRKLAKSERASELKELSAKISKDEFIIENNFDNKEVFEAVLIVKKEQVRKMILDEQIRADGRGLKEVRPISIETNILPSAHSSCLFTRGETQALVVGTIAGAKDGQMYETLTEKTTDIEKFMVHYNFPGFSVGEAKPIFGVGRRELGHGNLAKKALESSLPYNLDSTIRLVSEILESNGSSSMATVCGGSIALKAANIEISNLVAGIAMGLVSEGDKYAVLTDIMGLEDHDGDMDFKVAGTIEGITALQMDIKLGGIDLSVLNEALLQAKEGRVHILSIMQEASEDIKTSCALPIVENFIIDTNKIFAVIGKGGQTIKEIIDDFNVSIDLDKNSGNVKITAQNKEDVLNAKESILNIVNNSQKKSHSNPNFEELYNIGDTFKSKIERIVDFGAFVTLPKGGEGLLHISKMSKGRLDRVTDLFNVGDEIELRVLTVKKDRIELTLSNL